MKYEQNLDFVWATRWGQNVGNLNPIDMVIDNNSNVILAGTANPTIDFATVKINNSGVLEWVKIFNSTKGWDICRGIAKDNSGNIYITGESGTSGFPTSYDFTTLKYDPNGNEMWAKVL